MAKITIFVPDEVLAQMQAARTKTGPNWSRVATEAFEKTLQELKEARASMAAAVQLPYPTTGDFKVFEARRGRARYFVKVTGTVCDGMYRTRKPLLARIVSVFVDEFLEANPHTEDGATIEKMLTSTEAEAIEERL
jgi:hypothetical protein